MLHRLPVWPTILEGSCTRLPFWVDSSDTDASPAADACDEHSELLIERHLFPCSHRRLACRIDCFSDVSTNAFGEKLKEQVEERLRFYEEGVAPTKNLTAMQAAIETVRAAGGDENVGQLEQPEKKKKKKRKAAELATEEAEVVTVETGELSLPWMLDHETDFVNH